MKLVKVARFLIWDYEYENGECYTYFGIFDDTDELTKFIAENKAVGNCIEIMKLKTVTISKKEYEEIANNFNDLPIRKLLFDY